MAMKIHTISFLDYFIIIIIIIHLTANGFLPGGSGNTIRHNTQNNAPYSNKAQHTELHNRKGYILHTMNTTTIKLTNSVALVRKRTIPTERPPLVSKVSANFSG
jgi:hypothetical protein